MEDFKKGSEITFAGGKKATVVKKLGTGGQGAVYDVLYNGKHYALKWYLRDYLKNVNQKKFYNNLLENQKAGAPSKAFLWPLAVSEYKENSFGYLMDIRPKEYTDFSSILNAKVKFKSVRTAITAAKNVCEAFQSLHREGYSYQDINNGNFFVNINDGKVLVCDNDNVAPYGVWMGMIGKDRYMAPEVVLGKSHADMESDLYSLSVILFMIFFVAHPLEGEAVHACPCLTATYMRYFYAEAPVFCYDPKNDSNRPVVGVDNNVIKLWNCYPQALRDTFIRAFTKGLFDASHRVRENEWISCFDDMLGNLITCPVCGGEQFYVRCDDGSYEFLCEDCGKRIRKPFVLRRNHKTQVAYLGDTIASVDLSDVGDNAVNGKVVESSKHPGLWGIKLGKNASWSIELKNGKTMSGDIKKTIPLFADTKLLINNIQINITI